jgi:O-antigen ligase
LTRVVFILLLLLVGLAPLPLGSNREWSWTLCALLVAVLGLLWAGGSLFRRGRVSRPMPIVPVLLFLAVAGWILVQASTGTPAGWHHPLWQMVGEYLGRQTMGRISMSAEDSLVALLRLLAYGMVFLLAFKLGAERRRAGVIYSWLAVAGLAYSVYGLFMFWGEFDALLWFRDEAFSRDVRGTFVNRNSFATYVGLCIVCALCVLHRRLARGENPAYTTPADRGAAIEDLAVRAWMPLAAIFIMVSALILTHSRAGFGSFVFGAMVLAGAVRHRKRFRNFRSTAAVVTAFGVTIAAFVITSEVLIQRMDRLPADGIGRLDAYVLASGAIRDNPLLGFGYGTFADSFRLYRDDSLATHFDMAHNTYLENIFELGWPAAVLLFLCFAWIALTCLRGVRQRGMDWIFPAGGLAATALVAAHALFDFSLQMPANAITYACIAGVACAQSYSSRTGP